MICRRSTGAGFLALVFLLTTAGCGGSPGSVSVEGAATLDGSPLGGAFLDFSPADTGTPIGGAKAVTDDAGKFKIESSPQLRLLPGKYGVRVSKWVDKKTKQPVPADDIEQMKQAKMAVNVIPYRYSDPEANSPIIIELKSGANTGVKVEVKSK